MHSSHQYVSHDPQHGGCYLLLLHLGLMTTFFFVQQAGVRCRVSLSLSLLLLLLLVLLSVRNIGIFIFGRMSESIPASVKKALYRFPIRNRSRMTMDIGRNKAIASLGCMVAKYEVLLTTALVLIVTQDYWF